MIKGWVLEAGHHETQIELVAEYLRTMYVPATYPLGWSASVAELIGLMAIDQALDDVIDIPLRL